MDSQTARQTLTALLARPEQARRFLVDQGNAAFGLRALSLPAILRHGAEAPRSTVSRAFAVLLADAAAAGGILPTRGEDERALFAFLEMALLNPLRRAGYPFGAPVYDKRQALARIGPAIDEYLHPPGPTMARLYRQPGDLGSG